ncbi:SMC-Scp complex subunit ScpB [Haloglycomyces albus]|uniref:SMC-Scp complex subunit ScpB n=1 Tax=Haloglycomyces albus TaxID=526067 RepID=UPI0004B88019|nr:SMC-Scp complex subunit ScpB [Haloglycomyces albus]
MNDDIFNWKPPAPRQDQRADTPSDEPAADGADEYAQAVEPQDSEPVSPAAENERFETVPDEDLPGALEAILIVSAEPVEEDFLADLTGRPVSHIQRQLVTLSAEYTGERRGFDLRRTAGGWRLYTRGDYAGYVERYVTDGATAKLSKAALETLAVVAYRQPVTRGRISAIRGVNCDGVMRTLLTRGLVEECGSDPDSPALLYRTTTLFLERMGLESLDQLPELAPFLPDDLKDVENDAAIRQ